MMKRISYRAVLRVGVVAVLALGLGALATGQLRQVIKAVGVGAAVQRFGGDIDRQLDRLVGRTDTDRSFTKVVPILSVGLTGRDAIGAAQVMGTRAQVEKVKAVAAVDADLFGREVSIRALVPISTTNPTDAKKLSAVDGVGVSGIIDLKL